MSSVLPRSVALALLLFGCRYEVRLDDDDAGRDVALDARAEEDAGELMRPDVPEDDAVIHVRACEGEGVDLLPVRITPFEEASTFAATGEGGDRHFGVLVPPAARVDGSMESHLFVLDRNGTILSERDVFFGAGPTIHGVDDGAGFLVLADDGLYVLDPLGELLAPSIGLPAPPQRPGATGFIDGVRFLWQSSAPGGPIAYLDLSTGLVTTSSVLTGGSAEVLIHRGGVTVVAEAPTNEVVEYADILTGERTFVTSFFDGPLANRLVAVETTMGRRWVVADGAEFRNAVTLYSVPDATPPSPLVDTVIRAPLATELEGDLVTLGSSDGQLYVLDFLRGGFYAVTAPTGDTLGRVERDDGFYAVLYARLGATLAFRCGVP